MFNLNLPTKQDIENKRCLVRVDFNSSFVNENLEDDFRIKRAMPLIQFLNKNNAITILMTHLEENEKPIPLNNFFNFFKNNYFNAELQKKVHFLEEIIGNEAKNFIKNSKIGDIILLNNLRLSEFEEKGDKNFSKNLASLGDVYINEAFSASHRPHSSIIGIPKFLPKFCGFNFKKEIENLSKIFNPSRPFVVFIGGKKVATKEKVIDKFLEKSDTLVLGGVMAVEFYAAMGVNCGKTEIHKDSIELIKHKFLGNKKIILPDRVIVLRNNKKKDVSIEEIENNDNILDISPKFFESLNNKLKEINMVLWNGPMGYLENGFTEGTEKLAEIFFTENREVIAGGGETIDFIREHNLENKFSFISTGGGAMLEFLANETLPGIEALIK